MLLSTDADPTKPIIHQQSVHNYGYDPVFFIFLVQCISYNLTVLFYWHYGNKASLNFNQMLIWRQTEMEKGNAYKNSRTNWECAQLLSKHNSETDTEKQIRKLSVSTINSNNPIILILHNFDLHLTLSGSTVLSFEIKLDLDWMSLIPGTQIISQGLIWLGQCWSEMVVFPR